MATAFVRLTKAEHIVKEDDNPHIFIAIPSISAIHQYRGATIVDMTSNGDCWEVKESVSEVMERINHVKSMEKS